MSEDSAKYIARIAQLESELAGFRGKPVFDRQAFTLNPVAFMQANGVPVDHVTKFMVATALGDQAPPELRAQVAMGPQIQATQNLGTSVEDLSRRLAKYEARDRQESVVSSMQPLIVDKIKYPHLSAAVTADPSLLSREVSSMGDTADATKAAEAIEAKLAGYAKAFGFKPAPAAPSQNPAESNSTTAPDTNAVKPALTGASTDVPSIPANKPGPLTEDADRALRDSILRKHGLK